MILQKDKMFPEKVIFPFIYFSIIISISIYSLKKPAYNWDMLPYMGVILSYDHIEARAIHQQVYEIAKDHVPSLLYNRLTDPGNKYRAAVAQNPETFYQQLPFYVVKPLYTYTAYLFYKAGASLLISTVLPSVISYLMIGLLLFYWIQKYRSVIFSFTASTVVMLSAPMLSVTKLSSPDTVSGLILFIAIFFIVEKASFPGASIFLLLAIFARIDNIIPAVFLLTTVQFSKKWNGKINLRKYMLLILAMILSCFFISSYAYSFGWNPFYYPDFMKQLNISYNASSTFIFEDYIVLVKSQLMTGLFFSFISFFLLLILFLLPGQQSYKFSELSIEQLLALAFVLIIFTRFILQPLLTDRLYISYYLSVIVFLIKKYSFSTSGQFYTR